jgi:microcystin-dependent protein
MEAFIGSIILFAGNFAPRGWAFCEGQLLPIAQNTALFSILGTTYGGNGQTTFALPDLRGRVPIGFGNGPGLQSITLGESAGTNTNMLTVSELPRHTHTLNANATTVGRDLNALPTGNFSAQNQDGTGNYASTGGAEMNPQAIGMTGSGTPVNNMQPFLGLNYIICMQGIFPSRN